MTDSLVEHENDIRDTPDGAIPDTLPVIPLSDAVVYPFLIIPLMFSNERLIQLTDEALSGNKLVALFTQKEDAESENVADELYQVGTAAMIVKMLRFPNGSIRVVVQGLSRIRLKKLVTIEPYLKAKVEKLEVNEDKSIQVDALMRNAVNLFQRVVQLTQHLPNEIQLAAMNIAEPGKLADFIAANLSISLGDRQDVLETINVEKRLRLLNKLLNREVKILELGNKIQNTVKDEMDKDQKEYYLREQLQAIRKELGEDTAPGLEIDEFRQKIEEANMPEEAKEAAEKELDRLAKMPPAAAEYTVSRTYLDWLVTLPWSRSSEDNLDLAKAQQILDDDHYGLDKIKERIIEYLAVRQLKKTMKGPIFCFVGPPGVGKTSLGRSIARALGREFVRVSLGGMRDEAEIRGHRRTYIGSLPGRVIQGLRSAGTNNPVFMLDEVDKIGTDFRGDPASALLEVLDPEQNKEFSDHYLEVKFDLSKVMFITTANHTAPIPRPLLDRMEMLEIPGYTLEEKVGIAARYLLPRQLDEHGITSKKLIFADNTLTALVEDYTREAGVRNLEREIATICRKVAKNIALGKRRKVTIKPKSLATYLGPKKFLPEVSMRDDEIGVTTGLAWTSVGGTIMFIEATKMPGKGSLIVTGLLGDVMKESTRIALSLVRSKSEKIGFDPDDINRHDIHIHVPSGAVPKDGPSAGVSISTSLASLLSERPVRHDIAMTGEVTLQGKVLPIGGVKEKVLAARQAGIHTVILPDQNKKDLLDVPDTAKAEMDFKFVDHIDQVLRLALIGKPKKINKKANDVPSTTTPETGRENETA